MTESDLAAVQLCVWWGQVNSMRDRIIYQAHLAGIDSRAISEAIGLHRSTVDNAITKQRTKQQQQ